MEWGLSADSWRSWLEREGFSLGWMERARFEVTAGDRVSVVTAAEVCCLL